MSQETNFPEINKFLEQMQMKKSVFGYDKEDVFVKIRQLNRMYQEQLLLVRGQSEAVREQIREELSQELDGERKAAEQEIVQLRQEAEQEIVQLRQEAEREIAGERETARREIEESRAQAKLAWEEKNAEHRKELKLLEEEINRIMGQLQGLQNRVGQMAADLQKV